MIDTVGIKVGPLPWLICMARRIPRRCTSWNATGYSTTNLRPNPRTGGKAEIFGFRSPTRVSRAIRITRARDCCSSLRWRTRACSQPPGQPGSLIGDRWAVGRNSSALKARATIRAERSTFRMPTNQISKTSVYWVYLTPDCTEYALLDARHQG